MGNGFRRMALAQGLLPQDLPPEESPAWTDEALAELLQVEKAPSRPAQEPHSGRELGVTA
jgi:hypothetical protein